MLPQLIDDDDLELFAESVRSRRIESDRPLQPKHSMLSLSSRWGKIHYLRTGPAHAPQILMIPGENASLEKFYPLIEVLRLQFDVLAVSPPPFHFSMEERAKFWLEIARGFHLRDVTIAAYAEGIGEIRHALRRFGPEALCMESVVGIRRTQAFDVASLAGTIARQVGVDLQSVRTVKDL